MTGLRTAVESVADWFDANGGYELVPTSFIAERVLGFALGTGRWPDLRVVQPGEARDPNPVVLDCFSAGPAAVWRTHAALHCLGKRVGRSLLLGPVGSWPEDLSGPVQVIRLTPNAWDQEPLRVQFEPSRV